MRVLVVVQPHKPLPELMVVRVVFGRALVASLVSSPYVWWAGH